VTPTTLNPHLDELEGGHVVDAVGVDIGRADRDDLVVGFAFVDQLQATQNLNNKKDQPKIDSKDEE
jgi:hypothetical protein